MFKLQAITVLVPMFPVPMFPLSKGVYDTINAIFNYLVGMTTFNLD